MSEPMDTPYGLSSSFHPTGRENENGPWGERAMPLAMRSMLPPRSRKAESLTAGAPRSESGVPAKISTFSSGAIVLSPSETACTA